MKYTGTVVFVSHDRYFIDNLATRVFEIGDGKVEIYPGNYEDYLWRKQGGAARQTETISNELVGELSANRVVTGLSPAPQAPTNGNALKPEPADSKARRLNPIKRQQMETACTKSKKRSHALKPRLLSVKRSFRASSVPKKPTSDPGTCPQEERCARSDEAMGGTFGDPRK